MPTQPSSPTTTCPHRRTSQKQPNLSPKKQATHHQNHDKRRHNKMQQRGQQRC